MQGYCDVYKWTILKRTSPEVKCLHLTSSRCETCTPSVSNVIYHKFSHGAVFCALNGDNVNVMLEFVIPDEIPDIVRQCVQYRTLHRHTSPRIRNHIMPEKDNKCTYMQYSLFIMLPLVSPKGKNSSTVIRKW